ncbi:hypothetical protein KCU85_g256, partial [Aureobasidium melanogenum]
MCRAVSTSRAQDQVAQVRAPPGILLAVLRLSWQRAIRAFSCCQLYGAWLDTPAVFCRRSRMLLSLLSSLMEIPFLFLFLEPQKLARFLGLIIHGSSV